MNEFTSPIPLTDTPRPPFPTTALPGWLRAFVEAEAEATQTPPDLAAMLSLAVLAADCAKRIAVRAYPGWTEPCNLYVAVALPPGNRKSAVFAAMTGPVSAFEQEEARRIGPLAAQGESQRKIAEQALGHAQQIAAKAAPEERIALAAEADRLAAELEVMVAPTPPRLLVDDCSPEKLASLLSLHDGRMAAMSAEGGLFDTMAGRYSSGAPNLDVFLKGHAGDDLRVDRVGRPPDFVRAPALTLGIALQPEVIAGLAGKPGFRGRGLLGRFLFSLPESFVGRRTVNPPPVPEPVRETYRLHVRALLQLPDAAPPGQESKPHVLDLMPDARAALEQFEIELEPRLGEFGDLGPIADWAGKLVGAVVRIAGLLHVADHTHIGEPWQPPVTVETMAAAIEIGDYLIAHAQTAFGLMGADPVVEDARHVRRWLQVQDVATISKRDLHQGVRSRFPRVDAMDSVLALLLNHGYLREQPSDAAGRPGRKPSPIYEVCLD